MANSGGAANFFGDDGDQAAGLEEHIQQSEGAFEDRAVRTLLRRFNINNRGWEVKGQLRFPHFDDLYPNFPVRLGTRRLVSKRRKAESRKVRELAFHELKPSILFKADELRKTQMYYEWCEVKEDQSRDRRSVGLVFQCVSTLFVVHDWDDNDQRLNGVWLRFRGKGGDLSIETFDQFLNTISDHGWRPD